MELVCSLETSLLNHLRPPNNPEDGRIQLNSGLAMLLQQVHPRYRFDYSIHDPHTGDIKSQWEARDGDVVKGSYSVVEADGTIRTVEYTADKHNGFNAIVKRTGQARHPQSKNVIGSR
jgi:hypothetical protein